MALVKQEGRGRIRTSDSEEVGQEENAVSDHADLELDELLRTLRLDHWFAVAEEGMPLWAC